MHAEPEGYVKDLIGGNVVTLTDQREAVRRVQAQLPKPGLNVLGTGKLLEGLRERGVERTSTRPQESIESSRGSA